MVGRLLSFGDTIFSGAMLVSGRVSISSNLLKQVEIRNLWEKPPWFLQDGSTPTQWIAQWWSSWWLQFKTVPKAYRRTSWRNLQGISIWFTQINHIGHHNHRHHHPPRLRPASPPYPRRNPASVDRFHDSIADFTKKSDQPKEQPFEPNKMILMNIINDDILEEFSCENLKNTLLLIFHDFDNYLCPQYQDTSKSDT